MSTAIATTPPAPAWQKGPPDKPGWWWRWAYGGAYMCLVTRRVINPAIGEEIVIQMPSGLHEPAAHYAGGGWWSGPLEPPPPPDDSGAGP